MPKARGEARFPQRRRRPVESEVVKNRSEERALRKARGDTAEGIVAAWLAERGYEILERNLRLGYLEIDIVARQGRIIAVVEVRTRGQSSFTTGFSSISREKKRRIRWAGERLWNRRFKYDPTVDRLRFDAASVSWEQGAPRIEYAAAAF